VFCCILVIFYFLFFGCNVWCAKEHKQNNFQGEVCICEQDFQVNVSNILFCVYYIYILGVNNSCGFCTSFVSNSFLLAMFYKQLIFVMVCIGTRQWTIVCRKETWTWFKCLLIFCKWMCRTFLCNFCVLCVCDLFAYEEDEHDVCAHVNLL
jgi:hypothetical protein